MTIDKLFAKYGAYAGALAAALIMGAATWAAQRYALPELEENYVFLWDGRALRRLLMTVGGGATIAAQFFAQFMQRPLAGTLLMAAYYGAMALMLCSIGKRLGMRPWAMAAALLPCACLWLCLENNAYKPQGHAAYAIAVAALWAYTRWIAAPSSQKPSGSLHKLSKTADKNTAPLGPALIRTAISSAAVATTYWLVGPDALLLAGAMLLCDILARRPRWWLSIAYPAVALACAQASCIAGLAPAKAQAFGPGMYCLWDSTAYMQAYAWCALGVFLIAARMRVPSSSRGQAIAAAITLAAIGAFTYNIYARVHSPASYRAKTQRYHAKRGDWDAILAMDYSLDREGTPFTSYRFLAMAHRGILPTQMQACRPYIGYYMTNKRLVQKEDLQVLSDIFYDCRYMGAARKAAFDTDIVTPGAFNPVETKKLVDINIAYGDYAVADKLIRQLEKTMAYRQWARQRRACLRNDSLVEAHPQLGPMRRAIPADNGYVEPRTTGRDLRRIAENDPDQLVAGQFAQAFSILTNINE